jgi:cyclase
MGDIIDLARRYREEGADELVFYDITASSDARTVGKDWVRRVAKELDIPFCVAGGIRTLEDARQILHHGADKISVNSPALERPEFISELAHAFGVQCVVVGIDSREMDGRHVVCQYTGDESKTVQSTRDTFDWAHEAQARGAGEIVLNCMNQDGMRQGYDVKQLQKLRQAVTIPIIASGGAGEIAHFADVFKKADVDGALAASVLHSGQIAIPDLKAYLKDENIEVRL